MYTPVKLKSNEIAFNYRQSRHSKRERMNSIRTKEEIKFFDEDNNLIDYFIEIGINPSICKEDFLYNSSLNEINKKLIPQIISKFPETNKKSMVINNKIINHIFPNGFKAIESPNKPEPYFFAIMLDNQLYSVIYKYKYLACYIIYESISDYRILYNKYYNKEDTNENNNYNNIYIPKCLCIASVHPSIDKYEEILKIIYEDTISNKYKNLFFYTLIEELVIKTPKIPPGYKKVILKINEKQINLTEKKINEYPLIHTDLAKLFALFNINALLDIFKFILYEGNLIFFSSKIYDLTNSIMSILSLLSPFKYQYQVISVLSKELFSYIESDVPFIFGINQKYSNTFFDDNKINLKKKIVCIVDLDEKKYEIIPNNYNVKENPEYPKHFKEKTENKVQEYYKRLFSSSKKSLDKKDIEKNNNKIAADNEQYQIIFYKCMVELFEDYPKYLKKDINLNNINNMETNEIIDTNLYLNVFNGTDKEFYKKIFKTKMFKEFIIKRVDPRNNIEKIEAIFFEEKINERIAEKKMFGKTKIREQNKLLSSKDFDYLPEPEIIDLSNQDITFGMADLFRDNSFVKENCLLQGYIIEENKEENNSFTFSYYIFPNLFDSKSKKYLINANNYSSAPILYKHFDLINSKIIKKTTIKFDKKPISKKFNLENDLYICYVILWSLTFWYTDEKEKEYRFKKMLNYLDKIVYQKQEIFQLLLENLSKWGGTEDEIFYVYIKFLSQKLNPNWIIFQIVFPILEKKEMNLKENPACELLRLSRINFKLFLSKLSRNKEAYFKRSLKSRSEWEDSIISDDVRYICYSKCIGCCRVLDIGKICSKLSNMHIKNQSGIDMVKCTYKNKDGTSCDYYNFLRIKFRYGQELFNPKLTKLSTCRNLNMPLLSTTTLKEKLMEISKNYKELDQRLDIDLFKRDHQLEFWNAIWYFELNQIDISFILPYSESEKETPKEINDIKYTKTLLNNHKVSIVNDNKNLEIERSNFKTKYFQDNLCEQICYQFAFIKDIGMISYKNIYLYEDNINFNELPLAFENILYEQDNEHEEASLVRCLTSNNFNNLNDYSGLNSSFGSSYISNTPVTKKYTNYVSILRKSNASKKEPTLVNSSSSPMLLNNNNNANNNNNQKSLYSSKNLIKNENIKY